jgi:hypothetical protein
MGNVFKGPQALCTALLVCSTFACSSDEDGGPAGTVPAYQESLNPAPATPGVIQDMMPAAQPDAPAQAGTQPTSPSNETPAAGQGTPISPPSGMMGSTTPPSQQPPTMQPPVMDPPVMDPPPVMEPPPVVDGPDPNFFVFLLIGQSNMEGVPPAQAQDTTPNQRVKVLALRDCPQRSQVHDQWYTASPSLHTCANTLGPGDYFAKTLADALPNVTIGLVPDAIAGVDIDIFRKGVISARRGEWSLPPDNRRNSAYETVVERAKLAQQVGVIKGILFHQGESDSGGGQQVWLGKVKDMLDDLKVDLALPNNLPFLAGELLYSPPGCCGGFNTAIGQLPSMIPGAVVIRANGLNAFQGDGGTLHFDTAGQREFGRRYAQAMLGALGL